MKSTVVIGPQFTRGDAPTVRAFAFCGVCMDFTIITQRLYSPGRPTGDNPEEAFKAEAEILKQIIASIAEAEPQVLYSPDGPDAVENF